MRCKKNINHRVIHYLRINNNPFEANLASLKIKQIDQQHNYVLGFKANFPCIRVHYITDQRSKIMLSIIGKLNNEFIIQSQ